MAHIACRQQIGMSRVATGLLGTALMASLAACSQPSGGTGDIVSQVGGIDDEREIAAGTNIAEWETLEDAYNGSSQTVAMSYDKQYCIEIVRSNGRLIRVVAGMDDDTYGNLADGDARAGGHDVGDEEIREAMSLALKSSEDITAGTFDQEQLEALVGKTGKDLISMGYRFEGQGDETGKDVSSIPMANGFFRYVVTFENPISWDDAEGNERAVQEAIVKNIELEGLSADATDPSSVKVIPPGE